MGDYKVKVGGAWVKGVPNVKVGGAWVRSKEVWVKVGGAWTKAWQDMQHIYVTAAQMNLNLSTLIASKGFADGNITVHVTAGIRSVNTTTPACTTGDLTRFDSVTLSLEAGSYIYGKGGAGGGGNSPAGKPGGVGLQVLSPLRVVNNTTIAGGGGGGGLGANGPAGKGVGGGGGGGGGADTGAGGAGGMQGTTRVGPSGKPGTLTAGGAGAGPRVSGGGRGGNGGALGVAGAKGANVYKVGNGGAGGAAGNAVTGNAKVTWVKKGTIKGALA